MQIKNATYGGERPLFASHGLRMEHVTIQAGESALKECSDIEAVDCRFEGKYPFWHVDGFVVRNCLFTEGARAALWYSRNLTMSDTLVKAPKMFREMDGIRLENVRLPFAQETLWHCRNVRLRNVRVDKGDYIFMHGENIRIEDYAQRGNYSFQYCRNVVIRNAVINSKDAFWNTEDVTVYDSEINGEYLGWHSKRLRLVNCKILDIAGRHRRPRPQREEPPQRFGHGRKLRGGHPRRECQGTGRLPYRNVGQTKQLRIAGMRFRCRETEHRAFFL